MLLHETDYCMRHCRQSEWSCLIVCHFLTSCLTSQFPPIWSFSLSSLSPLISLNVFFFSSTLFVASSNVTSHLFYPSTDHSRLVFRALEPALPVSRETPAGRVDTIYCGGTQQPSCQHILVRERLKCNQSGLPDRLSADRQTHTQKPHTLVVIKPP